MATVISLQQYRQRVRSVACPHCHALPDKQCMLTKPGTQELVIREARTDSPPGPVLLDYVHDDRSLAYQYPVCTEGDCERVVGHEVIQSDADLLDALLPARYHYSEHSDHSFRIWRA